jgi:hypothetical protein
MALLFFTPFLQRPTHMSTESKLRYEPGKIYHFVLLKFLPSAMPSFGPYRPWLGDSITKLEIVELTCQSHHKVKWVYDPTEEEAKHDGFIFVDKTGAEWYNQYPRAEYGQLDDTADWIVARAKLDPEVNPDWDAYTDITMYLRRIGNGIKRFLNPAETSTDFEEKRLRPIAAESLQKHFDHVVELLKTEYGYTARTEPYTIDVVNVKGETETRTLENAVRVIVEKA